ncbi:MAG: hypothetical protein Q4B58_02755 [Bacteroidales bacterium]|nr:hypothetical protein [Bacteroidales bacterium]
MKKQLIPTEEFVFPPSVQSDLFQYLKPKQQEKMRHILRPLKKWAQAELATSLIDFLESGNPVPPTCNCTLIDSLFWQIINNEVIRPLNNNQL